MEDSFMRVWHIFVLAAGAYLGHQYGDYVVQKLKEFVTRFIK